MPAARPSRVALAAVVAATLALPATAAAQRRAGAAVRKDAPPADSTPARRGGMAVRRARPWEGLTVATDVALVIGERRFATRVQSQCELDEAATPGTTRAQWWVSYPPIGVGLPDGEVRQVALSVWPGRNADGTQELTFSAFAGGLSTSIQTRRGAQSYGRGGVRVTRTGAGARFEVQGRDVQGRAVQATIDCAAVRRPEASGG